MLDRQELSGTLQAYRHRAVDVVPKAAAGAGRGRLEAWPTLCVLIVEFRDEVYADLKAMLEEVGLSVQRAATGDAVAQSLSRFSPDMILINEDMPDDSGWLITCKLRLDRHQQPVWLYVTRRPHCQADWSEFCGVDEVVPYGGLLSRLLLEIRIRIYERLDLPTCRLSDGLGYTGIRKVTRAG